MNHVSSSDNKQDMYLKRMHLLFESDGLIVLTRGQRPNESQKAVMIDKMKSVCEIASKIWPVV